MEFKRLSIGMFATNCYVLFDSDTKEAAVIDPAGDFDIIKNFMENNNLNVKYIILTHGHADHIVALSDLKEYTGALVCINQNDEAMLRDNNLSQAGLLGLRLKEINADMLLKDNEVLMLGNTKLEILYTPGHTDGSICVKCEDNLFAGDTLFARSIGRTDFPGGSYEKIVSSIKNRLYVLTENIRVYPGHGGSTTIGDEKKHNSFVRG